VSKFLYPLKTNEDNQKKTTLLNVPLVASYEYPLYSGSSKLCFSVDSSTSVTHLIATVNENNEGIPLFCCSSGHKVLERAVSSKMEKNRYMSTTKDGLTLRECSSHDKTHKLRLTMSPRTAAGTVAVVR
jgi:hypothetical protein